MNLDIQKIEVKKTKTLVTLEIQTNDKHSLISPAEQKRYAYLKLLSLSCLNGASLNIIRQLGAKGEDLDELFNKAEDLRQQQANLNYEIEQLYEKYLKSSDLETRKFH